MEGAILISRRLIDSEVFASEKMLKVWIWILIKANHKARTVPIRIGQGQSLVTIERGQMLFGRLSAESELRIDASTIYRCIKKLEALNNIVIKSSSHYSIITICHYDYYQTLKNYKVAAGEQPVNNRRAANEQPMNTLNNDKNDKYSNGWNENISDYNLIAKFFPKLFKLTNPLKLNEHSILISKYGQEKTMKIYGSMQNYKPLLHNNESAYLTAVNWLERDEQRK